MEAKDIWRSVQAGLVIFGGWLGMALGGFDGFLYALLVLIAVDYATGIMCAIIEKKLSSEIGFRGIFKKVLILVLVGIGNALDQYVLGTGETVRTAVIFFYASNEGVSLLENAARIGLPIPEKLRQILAQLHERGSEK